MPEPMATSLKTDSLHFAFSGGSPLFENLSLEIIPAQTRPGRGFVTVVMGPSGCGKSTLLRLILGELVPKKGRIDLNPSDARCSYLAQDPVLFEHLSINENAMYFSSLRNTRATFDKAVFTHASRELRLEEVLARESMAVANLSGGEKQRIALLRALSIRPSLLLLDEACRGIDIPARQEFLYYLRRFADQFGLAVVYVTHNPAEARLLADRIIYLHKPSSSKAREPISGTLDQLLAHPPHESIAMGLTDEPMNRVPAVWNGTVLSVLGVRCEMREVTSQPPFSGNILFKASQVRWVDRGGFSSASSELSGAYQLAAARSPSWQGVVAGIRPSSICSGFLIDGAVHVYGMDGRLLSSGSISPLTSG